MVRLRLLGGAQIEDDGAVLTGAASRRHPLALLAVLAAERPRQVSRSKLSGLLWPESTEERARGRLNSCLHRVRKALGEGSVRSVGDDLRLDPDLVVTDLSEFEGAVESGDAERAIEIYAGPFLEGFHLPGSAPFEKWVDRMRDRLERRHRAALEQLAEASERAGDMIAAADWWRRRASADPYDTRVVLRLMEALARAGNPAEALRAARVHERLLEEELEVAPGSELHSLVERLKRGEVVAPAGALAGKEVEDDGEPPPVRPAVGVSVARGSVETGSGPTATSAAAGEGEATAEIGPRHFSRLIAAAAIGLVLLAAGLWLLERGEGGPASDSPRPGVAVLPFEAVGDEPPEELSAGLHSDLLTRLSNVGGLKVVSGTSVQRYRGSGLAIGEIARELGVGWIVEGSVQQAGDRIQVNVQLIDAGSDAHAWAHTYRRALDVEDLGSVFEVQADITTNVARALGERLTAEERRRVDQRPTADLAAFRHYVEGRRHLEERTVERLTLAVASFRRALERDSTFALAWAGLADAVDLARTYGVTLAVDVPEPEAAARRAVELAPDLGEAHASLGRMIFRDDVPGAVRELRRAVELQPSYAQAHHWLGYLELAFGDLERARDHVTLATELNPRLLPARGNVARVLTAERSYGAALTTSRAVMAEASEWERGAALDELTALYHLDRWDELRGAARRHAEQGSGFEDVSRTYLALADAAEGDTTAARRALGSIRHPFYAGLLHAAIGDTDAAFAAWDQELDGAPRGPWYVTAWRYYFPEVLAPVRADPRFAKLIRDVRAEWGIDTDEDLAPG